MSDQKIPAPGAPGADGQSPTITSAQLNKKRRGDKTITDQDAVREYLSFKQSRGLMSESEKRLLDKIAAVCGMPISSADLNAPVTPAKSNALRNS